MHRVTRVLICALVIAIGSGTPASAAQSRTRAQSKTTPDASLERRIRAHLTFLAGDALKGRRSGTEYERIAAEYIGSQFLASGLQPGAANPDDATTKSFVQRVPIERVKYTAAPTLRVEAPGFSREWTFGKDFQVRFQMGASASGTLTARAESGTPRRGAWFFPSGTEVGREQMMSAYQAGARGVIMRGTVSTGSELPRMSAHAKGTDDSSQSFTALVLSAEAAADLEKAPADAVVTYSGPTTSEEASTWNAIGVLPGADPALANEVVMLSAHLDHLGERPGEPDPIYNGADDDASGCAAVLELARALGAGPRPKRTVYFVCFGSEESGGLGSDYFVANPPVPISQIAVDLNFEMLGRADAAVAPGELWLTGYDRSNLGPTLAARGARLVADPHPEEHFFERSDNYTLAKRGVVAQSVSSFGLHPDYHQPSDEVSKIDFQHMARSINSLIRPVRWLVSARFKPAWLPGKQPTGN